jgi:hypothetical protein
MIEHVTEDRSPTGERRFRLFITDASVGRGKMPRSPLTEARNVLTAHIRALGLRIDSWEVSGATGGLWLSAYVSSGVAPPPLPRGTK